VTWSCLREMRRSDSLNPYGMFQPSGPNLRRSCTMAWKKHSPYISLLNACRQAAGQSHTSNFAVSNPCCPLLHHSELTPHCVAYSGPVMRKTRRRSPNRKYITLPQDDKSTAITSNKREFNDVWSTWFPRYARGKSGRHTDRLTGGHGHCN